MEKEKGSERIELPYHERIRKRKLQVLGYIGSGHHQTGRSGKMMEIVTEK